MTWLDFKRPKAFILTGVLIAIIGFIYDAKFAGLPFQDPTPEMQANWLFHKALSEKVVLSGLTIFAVACLWQFAGLVLRKLK